MIPEYDNNKGYVYVLSNPYMPGLVKIGMTTRCDVNTRVKELYSTGVPVAFEVEYACMVSLADCAKIETALHRAFAPQRINSQREFFEIKPSQAIAILELFDNRIEATQELSEQIEETLNEDDKIAQKKARRLSRKPLHYQEMGIEIGSQLSYIPDSSICVEVVSGRRVSYRGERRSLSAVTMEVRGISRGIQPTPYWSYEGRCLQDIYDETYPPLVGEVEEM